MVDLVVSAVVGALAAGANDGLKEATKKVIADGYEQLKSLLLRHRDGKADVADALSKLEAKPESEARQAVLLEEIESSGAAKDAMVQDQARQLLNLIQPLSAENTSGQIAIGSGIAQADRGSSAGVTIHNHRDE